MQMTIRSIVNQARKGRPDIAAVNAVTQRGNLRLAAWLARFPHASGELFTARELVTKARKDARS